MDINSSALVAAWGSLPREPAIAYYGEDSLVEGIKITIAEYRAFTEMEKLDALNTLVDSKHCLVIAPATCGSYVPVSQMATEDLIFSALLKPRNEPACLIDSEIRPVFEELVTLIKDPEPAVSAQALEDIQDMVMDQTLRQISKGNVKYVFVYQDELMDCSVMVLGNRKILSFDTKKIKSLQNKNAGLLQGINSPAKPAPKRSAKPKPKKQSTSEESSSESESSTSSESSSDSSPDDGQRTPVIPPPPPPPILPGSAAGSSPIIPPRGANSQTGAELHARDLLAAENLLLEAQRRVEALRSVSVHAVDQPSGPALKSSTTANVAQDPYSIPKKSVMLKRADSQHSRKSKPSKGARKAKKAAKKARKAKKKAAKKEAKRARKSKKSRRPASSESMSSSSESSTESSSDAPPPKDDQDHQVLCSVCCKNTAHLF